MNFMAKLQTEQITPKKSFAGIFAIVSWADNTKYSDLGLVSNESGETKIFDDYIKALDNARKDCQNFQIIELPEASAALLDEKYCWQCDERVRV